MTWKPSAIRHDTENARLRLSKGANHKSSPRAREYILAEYDAPPEVTLENIQQVRAVWQSREERWDCTLSVNTTSTPNHPATPLPEWTSASATQRQSRSLTML